MMKAGQMPQGSPIHQPRAPKRLIPTKMRSFTIYSWSMMGGALLGLSAGDNLEDFDLVAFFEMAIGPFGPM